jgi:glycosyltransferase involved in cell wall biosynthesis
MPEKVLLLPETTFPPVSRANLRLFQLGRELVRRGYSVEMLVPSTLPHKGKSGTYEGIEVYQFPGFHALMYSRLRLLVRLYHLLATVLWGIYRVWRRKIDIIHSWHPLAGFAAVLIGKATRRPVYVDFTDLYSDLAIYDSPLLVPFFRFIETKTWRWSEKVIVVSEEMRRVVAERGVPEEKISIIPDGGDPKTFHPGVSSERIRKKYRLEGCRVCIYHGDIKHFDGVDILLEAFSKVKKEIPEARLLILGGGGPYFERKIRPMARRGGLQEAVIFTGWVDHGEVPEYIAASDVGAMPLRETLNNHLFYSFKLFEYWGMEKPVVASKLRTLSTIIRDGVNGLLVEPGNPEVLAEAILALFKDPERARKMGFEGRRLVERDFNWAVLMSKEADLYSVRSSP